MPTPSTPTSSTSTQASLLVRQQTPSTNLVSSPTCHVLAVRVMDLVFCDNLLRAFVESFYKAPGETGGSDYPGLSMINRIYNTTSTGSPGRRLMVDFYVEEGLPCWFDVDADGAGTPHPEFMEEIVPGLMASRALTSDSSGQSLPRKEVWHDLRLSPSCRRPAMPPGAPHIQVDS